MHGVRPRPSVTLWLFFTFGLLALLSSVRSFWPPLSVVQGCLFFLVLLLAELLCSTFSSTAILRATYYGLISLFIFAILLGLAFPNAYPLTVTGGSDRHRLVLFKYIDGDFAYMTGLGVLIGKLPAVRAPWYSQLFLAFLTVSSGSRACTIALIVIWVALELFRARDFRLTLGISALGGAAVTIGLLLVISGSWGFGAGIHHNLQAFYGSGTLEQSPWDLSGRVGLWEAATGTFDKSVFLGFGFRGARDQLLQARSWAGGPHNGFLGLLLAAGGLGLISFLAGWVSAIRTIFKSKTGRHALAIHCFILIVAVTGSSFSMNQFFAVFLILCLLHSTRSLDADESTLLVIRRWDMRVRSSG